MIDTFYLEMEEEEYEDETILHKALSKKFTPIKINDVEVNSEIHINSTALEIAKYYGTIENSEKDYEKRKSVAPVWETCLKKWIAQLETYYLGEETFFDCNGSGDWIHKTRKKHPLIFTVYEDIERGDNRFLYEYTPFFIERFLDLEDGEKIAQLSKLEDIAHGVALAYLLPKLKQELKRIKEFGIDTSLEKSPVKQKLNWTGTPAQFGFIIDLLIQNEYLKKPTGSFEKDANFYLEHFNINTTKATLAKELSENTNSIETKYRKRITILHKDNLSKSESMAKVSGK